MKMQYNRSVLLSVLMCVLCMMSFLSVAQEAEMEFPILLSTGMPAGEAPEDLLPTGAIAYVRANNLQVLLDNVDSLLTTFVPEKAVPPELQEIFAQPRPFLTFFGMQAFGQPVQLEQLSELIGVALDRPVSLALYPMPPKQGFILSVPVANPTVVTGIVQSALMPESVEQGTLGEITYYHVTGSNYQLPNDVYIVASDTTVFICGSMDVLGMLVNSADMGALHTDPLIAKAVQAYADRDLTIMLSPGMLKSQIPSLQAQLAPMAEPLFMQLRMGLSMMPPAQRMAVDARLRLQFGIDGLDQLLDYVEAYATGIYRVALERIAGLLTNLDGLTVSLNIGQTFQQMAFALYSQDIQAQTQSLPVDGIKQALPSLPGGKDVLVAVGKTSEAKPSELGTAILAAIEEELSAKGLPLDGFQALRDFYNAKPQHTPLTSRADWTIQTIGSIPEEIDFSQFNSLDELLQYAGKRLKSGKLAVPVTLMSGMEADVVAQYYAETAAMLTQRGENYAAMREKLPFREPMIDVSGQFKQEDLGDGLQQLTLEKIYTTRRGFFGYQQHALINRQIVMHQHTSNYELLYTPGPDPAAMKAVVDNQSAPVPGATLKLLDQAPEGMVALSSLRLLHAVPGLIDTLAGVEGIVHRELDAFLAKAQEIVDASGPEDIAQKLLDAKLSLPLALVSLNLDESGKVYAILPGNLHYPRPAVMPSVQKLFSELSANVSDMGGSASFMATQPDVWEFSSIQSTEGLAFMVKSVVNAFYDTYMMAPEGMEQLFGTVQHPADFQDLEAEQLLVNPVWEALMNAEGLPWVEAKHRAKRSRTVADMRAMGTAFGSYQVDNNVFPIHPAETEIQELEVYPNYYEGATADAWGMPIVYVSDAEGQNYLLISYGQDGAPGGWEREFAPDIIYMNGQFLAPYDVADSYDTYEMLNDALLIAARANAVDVTRSLLETGADAYAEDDEGNSAITIVEGSENEGMLDLFEEYGFISLEE